MRRVYREGAPMIIDLERKAKRNSPENLLLRLSAIEDHWEEIRALAQTAPRAGEIAQVLESLGAPTRPEQVGVDPAYIADGILFAKELRDRYTILQLLWDIDRLEEMKEVLMQHE